MSDRSPRIRVAVCVRREGEVLLVEHEKQGRRYWLLPGGGVEMGEALIEAAAREFEEETGYAVDVGRLVIVCEAIEVGGRHIVNLVFNGRLGGGQLRVGADRSLRDARWQPRSALASLEMYPPIGDTLLDCWDEDFAGPVRVLGNVWKSATDR